MMRIKDGIVSFLLTPLIAAIVVICKLTHTGCELWVGSQSYVDKQILDRADELRGSAMTQERNLLTMDAKRERLEIMTDLRMEGFLYSDIGAFFSRSKTGVFKILRNIPGLPQRTVSFDKTGRLRVSVGGRFAVTHNRRFAAEYHSWYGMKTRCGNPNAENYPNYGGRGIRYAPAWERFNNFYADMGPRPANHTLERCDNNKGYCKANCIWLPREHQARNMRTTKLTIEKVRCIRKEYANGGITMKSIGKRYGASESLIGMIVNGQKWKEPDL